MRPPRPRPDLPRPIRGSERSDVDPLALEEDRPKKRAREEETGVPREEPLEEQERPRPQGLPPRSRPPILSKRTRGLFTDEAVERGIMTHFDVTNHSLAVKALSAVPFAHDSQNLKRMSSTEIAEAGLGDGARFISHYRELQRRAELWWTALEEKDDWQEKRADTEKELKDLKERVSILEKENTSLGNALKETNDQKKKVEDEKGEIEASRKELQEQLEAEARTGEKFLTSELGKTFLSTRDQETISAYLVGDDYKKVADEQAMDIVRVCRRALRETGRFAEEDVMLLYPGLPDEEPEGGEDSPVGAKPSLEEDDPGSDGTEKLDFGDGEDQDVLPEEVVPPTGQDT